MNCLSVWRIPWQKQSKTRLHEQKREAVPKHSLPPQEQILSYVGRFINCPYGTPEKGCRWFVGVGDGVLDEAVHQVCRVEPMWYTEW